MSSIKNIQVLCRVRPLNEVESKIGCKKEVTYPTEDTVSFPCGKSYTFNEVFPPNTTQYEVYNVAAKSIVQDALKGYNGTIFTSSGKTYTMEGNLLDEAEMGIIPRIVKDIFTKVSSSENKFEIKVSHMEIYHEKIRDMLDDSETVLKVYESKSSSVVYGLKEVLVNNQVEMMDQLIKGSSNRKISSTSKNDRSSRSHSIFQILIHQEDVKTKKKLLGKLLLVDLAGNEKLTNTECKTWNESIYINKSLSVLTKVIHSLADGQKHIPYRDSQLTRLLKESLGGNSLTTIIICVWPTPGLETKSTLEFGCRAKVVKNNSEVNEVCSKNKFEILWLTAKDTISHMKLKRRDVESEIRRWRNGEIVPEEEWVSLSDSNIRDSFYDSTVMDISDDSFLSVMNQSGNTPVCDVLGEIDEDMECDEFFDPVECPKELAVLNNEIEDSANSYKLEIENLTLQLVAVKLQLEETSQQNALQLQCRDEEIILLTRLLEERQNNINSLSEQANHRNSLISKLINEELQRLASENKLKDREGSKYFENEDFVKEKKMDEKSSKYFENEFFNGKKWDAEKRFEFEVFALKQLIEILRAKHKKMCLLDSVNCEKIESFACCAVEMKNTIENLTKQLFITQKDMEERDIIWKSVFNYSKSQQDSFVKAKKEMEKERESWMEHLSKLIHIITEENKKACHYDSKICGKVEFLTRCIHKIKNKVDGLGRQIRDGDPGRIVAMCRLYFQNLKEDYGVHMDYDLL